jgi:hypothetical protein
MFVPLRISKDFAFPELGIGDRKLGFLTTLVMMPKTTVNKYY